MVKNSEKLKEFGTYNLFLKEKKFNNETQITLFNHTKCQHKKTCGPVTIGTRRYKADYTTGEFRVYELEEIFANKYNSIQRSKRMISDILKMNDFDWFCTLTFDNARINRTNDAEVFDCYVKFINNIQHQFPTLRYVTVLERHKKDNAIHFHLVLGGVPWRKLGLVNSGKVCAHWATHKDGICSPEYFNRTKHLHELKDTDGQIVYNITCFIYGFTTATRIVSREKCANYVKKYIDKNFGSTDVFKKRFYYSRNLIVPEECTRCIGADFDNPVDVKTYIKNDVLFNNARTRWVIDDYNLAQCLIDNDLKNTIERGLVPTEQLTPFD